MGCWCKKFDTHALPAVVSFPHKNHPALLFFQCLWMCEHQHCIVIDLVFENQQSAVAVYHQGFAGLAEFFSVMRASLRLHAHFMKHTTTAPLRTCSDFAHS